ncbi:MAG: cysteine desulfurase NifS [Peptococcaceae bacterium]|nr:MAG: cysteine desulfurase NifS [Peptococcaceae bacterium]
MRRVYFDHSSTTPLDPAAAGEMAPYLTEFFGNPSSFHYFGRGVRKAVEEAREKVAGAIGADPREIVFTSGGTESVNMAIEGIAHANRKKGNHIITCAVEHHCSLNTCKSLAKKGFEVTILPVDSHGLVSVDDVAAAVTERTILINIMHANNEVGTIQPVAEIGRLARERGVYFHSDACTSFGRAPVNVDDLGVSLLSLSAHKIYGPKGAGALYLRKGTRWQPLFHGGAQERLRRSGTENVPAIIGFGKTAELAANNLEHEIAYLTGLRDKIIREVMGRFNDIRLTGHPEKRTPNLASFCFEFIEGESMLLHLDMQGVAASSGSACTSGSLEPSHVLTSMGIPPDVAHGSLLLTLGKNNTGEDVDYFLAVLPPIIERLRDMSPLCHYDHCEVEEDCITCTARK